MTQLAAKDNEKRDAAAAKNDLESYIIATGSTLEEPNVEEVQHVTMRLPCPFTHLSILIAAF